MLLVLGVPSCSGLAIMDPLVAAAFLNICVRRRATHVCACRYELFLDEAQGHDLLWVTGVSDNSITDMGATLYVLRTTGDFCMLHIFFCVGFGGMNWINLA
jgi:hypothetical protein